MRACYDIRSPQLWTLENFNTLLQMKLDSIQTKTLSLQFVIQDSSGKVKEAYPNPLKTSLSSPKYREPLGFISGDVLFATYDYPFILFFQEAFGTIVLTITISFLFLLCIINFYQIIHDEKMKRKCQMLFVDNLLHDLKRPIENQLEICKLLPSLTPVQQTSFLERSHEQLNEMLQFTNHMLLQSMDVNVKQLHVKEFDIQKMLETLKQKDRWDFYKIKSFDIQTDICLVSPIISGDGQILFAVFQNFIDNSLKYSGEHVNIQITCMDLDPYHIQILFKDNGFGIATQDLKHVFECFYRGDFPKNKEVKGFGLGLYHAHMFILAHGGKINIESEVNEGTTILVTLPRKRNIKSRFKFSRV